MHYKNEQLPSQERSPLTTFWTRPDSSTIAQLKFRANTTYIAAFKYFDDLPSKSLESKPQSTTTSSDTSTAK